MASKEQKKLAKKLNRRYNFTPNTVYDLGVLLNDPQYKGQYVDIGKNGKVKSFIDSSGVEKIKAKVEQNQIDKDFKKYIKDEKLEAKKKERKTKKKLKEVKKDPTLAKEALEKAYKNYDEIVTKIEDAEDEGEDAKVRVLKRKKANATENLYKTSKAVQTLTGEGEMLNAYSYVTGQVPEEILTSEVPYETRKDPRRGRDVRESLDDPSKTLEILKKQTDLKKLSDEELIKTLKLNQK